VPVKLIFAPTLGLLVNLTLELEATFTFSKSLTEGSVKVTLALLALKLPEPVI